MIPSRSHRSRYWASLLLLFALLAAQPLWAEHIHLNEGPAELCDLGFHQLPAASGGEYRSPQPAATHFHTASQAPAPRDCQPARQSARAPPALLSRS